MAADPDAALDCWETRLIRDGVDEKVRAPLKHLPSLARTVGWLILSHHRLPVDPELKANGLPRTRTLKSIETAFKAEWCGANLEADSQAKADCWRFQNGLPLSSAHWRRHSARIAKEILKYQDALKGNWLARPYVAHLARLALMLADHYYSSQPSHTRYGEQEFPLYANTDAEGRLKQRLDEHLIGVEVNASRIVWMLPRLQWQLPSIARHRGFRRRTKDAPFLWQNRAFDLAESLRQRVARQGFFGVNMASTGCGKTLANGRVLYALAEPRLGARFTVALGLRILTLQTGDAYRERLRLGEEDLAVLVGGGAVRELHESRKVQTSRVPGSESAAELLLEETFVHFEGSLEDGPLNRWLRNQPRALLQAPIVVCTVDHLVPATEGIRGGHQILPMLRLLTADLVLDEVDDFDVNDLPAVTRLVHWAGMLGSRVLLSSATLPPALVQGLFQAYLRGREAFQASRGEPGLPLNVCCAWFDEFGATASDHADSEDFLVAHEAFVNKRIKKLSAQPQRHKALVKPLEIQLESQDRSEMRRQLCTLLAKLLRDQILELHDHHRQVDPASRKGVSIGLVRMANIDPLVTTVRSLIVKAIPENVRLHLCVYHSQFPLFLRSHIEARLDRLLKRHRPESLYEDKEMRDWLDRYPEREQIFVVLATPVAEVGRDHDYDWAIVEPSSIRSIIQLAGRVRRHRPGECQKVNIHLLSTNLKHLEGRKIAYTRPGYESRDFALDSHDLRELLRHEQLTRLDATPRIREHQPLEPRINLADLEHTVLRDLMLGIENKKRPVTLWWRTHVHLSGILQALERFRAGSPTEPYLLLPDDDGELHFSYLDDNGDAIVVDELLERLEVEAGPRIGWWDDLDDRVLLEQLAENMEMEPEACARQFAVVELSAGNEAGWTYHPALGFSRKVE